jgi:uncharacterized protein (TIGR00369 family)
MQISNMSGLELLRAMLNGDIPSPPIAETIPMRGVVADHGYVKQIARADTRHTNPLGGVHGGFAATVLDSVLGCAVHSTLEAGLTYGTIDLNIKMLRPIPFNEDVIAEATVVNISRNLGVAEGTIKNADGKILAYGSTTCLIRSLS